MAFSMASDPTPKTRKAAREKGILTIGVVTKPFHFEGANRMRTAERGIEELQQYVDTSLSPRQRQRFTVSTFRLLDRSAEITRPIFSSSSPAFFLQRRAPP
jgi:cell division protein FtsZ